MRGENFLSRERPYPSHIARKSLTEKALGKSLLPDLSLPPSSSLFDAIFSRPTPKAREKRPGDEVGEG